MELNGVKIAVKAGEFECQTTHAREKRSFWRGGRFIIIYYYYFFSRWSLANKRDYYMRGINRG